MELRIKLVPNARKNEITGWEDHPDFGRLLKVRITERAINGRANQAAIKFLAKQLGVPKSTVKLVKGHITRLKIFQVPDSARLTDLR